MNEHLFTPVLRYFREMEIMASTRKMFMDVNVLLEAKIKINVTIHKFKNNETIVIKAPKVEWLPF